MVASFDIWETKAPKWSSVSITALLSEGNMLGSGAKKGMATTANLLSTCTFCWSSWHSVTANPSPFAWPKHSTRCLPFTGPHCNLESDRSLSLYIVTRKGSKFRSLPVPCIRSGPRVMQTGILPAYLVPADRLVGLESLSLSLCAGGKKISCHADSDPYSVLTENLSGSVACRATF